MNVFFFFFLSCFFAIAAPSLTIEDLNGAGKVLGLTFNTNKQSMMLEGLEEQLQHFQKIRAVPLDNSVPPALVFNPLPLQFEMERIYRKPRWANHRVPAGLSDDDLAFCSVGQLSQLIRQRKVTSERLTRLSLERLKRFDPILHCVVTLTEERAMEQARRADAEIARGKYRGPLHGIPYGAKDLLDTKGLPTTWGSVPFRNRVAERNATVVEKLEKAGAVLVAKLSLGELAWGDVWFGGMTRGPWKTNEGSSGSSAGSAAATAAGLVPFAIGSETYGSIVSPCRVCGVTGLRPTFGRVSRAGAMALSWSMDKLGPLCRSVEDCAIVLQAIHGPDGIDQTVINAPFNYRPPDRSWKKLRIGYLQADFGEKNKNDVATLAQLRALGANLVPIELPSIPVEDLGFILGTEAAAAFDELTRSGQDDLLVRQIKNAWPNVFRRAHFVPAVEYLQAQRLRFQLVQEMGKVMKDIDVYLAPVDAGSNLLLTNLSGHPCVVLPNGFTEKGNPTAITFVGQLFGEAKLLRVAKVYQDATKFHLQRPPGFSKQPADSPVN